MDIEGVSDVFVRAYFDSKQAKETDTHYRCKEGKASFNYRLLFPFTGPADSYLFTVQCFDRDFFSSNDLIGEAVLDLKGVFYDVIETGKSFTLNKKYYESFFKNTLKGTDISELEFEDDDSFWLPVKGTENGVTKVNGYVRISFTLMPKEL